MVQMIEKLNDESSKALRKLFGFLFKSFGLFLVQGYRRLSVDIEAMRDTRREVRDKWKIILENLGNAGERRTGVRYVFLHAE